MNISNTAVIPPYPSTTMMTLQNNVSAATKEHIAYHVTTESTAATAATLSSLTTMVR